MFTSFDLFWLEILFFTIEGNCYQIQDLNVEKWQNNIAMIIIYTQGHS